MANEPRKLTAPWSIQVELVEGCTRLCPFCGLNGIREAKGGYKYASDDVVDRTVASMRELNPRARVEFAMHGEPLVHPRAHELIAKFRAGLPAAQLMVTTNGATLRKSMAERLDRLYAAGVDFVVLDTYYPERDELRAAAAALPASIVVRDFYDELAPVGWSPYHNHGGKCRRWLVLMDDIGARDGEHASRVLLNHAGSNPSKPVPPEPLQKTCTNPFREVTVAWNGAVNICCMDWKHEFVMGNVLEHTLAEIWYDERFEAARASLQAKDRNFTPCDLCDKGAGPRAGLLPKYPPPTARQRKLLPARNQAALLVQLRKRGRISPQDES